MNYQLLRERFETRLCLLKDLGEKNDDRRQADHLWCTNTSRSGSSPRRRFDLRATSGRESTVLLSSFRFVIYCRFSQNAAWSRVEKGARKSFTAIPRRFSFCPSLEDSKRTIYIIQYPRNEEHVTGFREFRNNFYHPLVEIDLYCNFKRIILKFSLSDSDPYLSANIFSRSFSFYLSKKWQNSWFKYTFFFCNVIWEDDNNFSRDGTRVIRTMQILQFLPGCVIL